MNPEDYMQFALREAEKAKDSGEVPVGAIVVLDEKIIAKAHNETESRSDATAHAEMLAIQRASEALSNWRLNEAALYVTLEPCTMCIGAMILSRVKSLCFGCADSGQGAVGSLYDLSDISGLPHSPEVFSGVLEDESRSLLEEFFKGQRAK